MKPNGPTGHRPPRYFVSVVAALALAALATQAFAITTPTDPEPDLACPTDYGTGTLTHYSTTVETPPDSTDWWVSVTFTIAGDGASCEVSLATYELPSGSLSFPQTLYDSETGTFGPGQHVLTAALPLDAAVPGCWAQYDFVFGPVLAELTPDDPYAGSRQIRARIVGSDECPESDVQTPTPTPTPGGNVSESTPTPAPREDTKAGTPTPEPGGTLPNTSVPAQRIDGLALFLAAIALGSASLVVATRSVQHRR